MDHSQPKPGPLVDDQNTTTLHAQITSEESNLARNVVKRPPAASVRRKKGTPGQNNEACTRQPSSMSKSQQFYRKIYDHHKKLLLDHIENNKFEALKLSRSNIRTLAKLAARRIDHFAAEWGIPVKVATEIVQLGIYDMIIFIDNSGSMRLEENEERLDDLKVICRFAAALHELFEGKTQAKGDTLEQHHSLQVCFMNGEQPISTVRDRAEMEEALKQGKFRGLTKLSSELEEKVLKPLRTKYTNGPLRRPVMVLVVTDGGLSHESTEEMINMLDRTYQALGQDCEPGATPRILSLQFAQVGNDHKAQHFLAQMKLDPRLRQKIDCTPNFEVLQELLYTAEPPAKLTPGFWLMKACLGAVDASYEIDSTWQTIAELVSIAPAEHSAENGIADV
ncbi:hypothetical protein FB567DRAFT_48531 [Paraphoma chrysanthemicola]|uniref:VWFA domain-containing protein n=1 Tax=Paraphoma chrysanthemicola TaxID=798071 RepID=A0A8K0RH59_9PLEO|nr:hypothetical protein FB567DRAFT_48531 [Paraphoma chrysanthemicola]